MTPHLSAVLRDFADQQGRAAAVRAPDPDLDAREIVSRVRRRRLARVSAIAGSAAAVVVLGAVVVFGVTRPEPAPPATPEPVPTESPTSSSTPSQTPRPASATAGVDSAVTAHPLLPAAQPLGPGMLAAAPLGSSLVTFQATCGYPCSIPTSPRVTYLVTPDGGHFELRFEGLQGGWITDWLPGSSRILISRSSSEGTEELYVVDAESGQVLGGPLDLGFGSILLGPADDLYLYSTSWEGGKPVSQLQRWSYAGELLASVPVETHDEQPAQLTWNANRSQVVYTAGRATTVDDSPIILRTPSLQAVDLRPMLVDSGRAETAVFSCHDLGWATSAEVLLKCWEWDTSATPDQPGGLFEGCLWIAGPDGPARRLGENANQAWPNEIEGLWVVGERLVGLRSERGGDRSLSEITASGFVDVASTDVDSIVGAAGPGLLTLNHSPATGGWSLALYNPFTGASKALLAPSGEAVFNYPSIVTSGPRHG